MSVAQVVRVVRESAYGTTKTSPVAGTDAFYINCTESNSFNATAVPVPFLTPYGGTFDDPADLTIDHFNVTGRLSTLLYPDQCKFWMDLAVQRINAGQSVPWTTTEPPGDLASFTLYHAMKTRAGTWKRMKFLGGKVAGLEISVSRSQPRATLNLDLVFQKVAGHSADSSSDPDATEFPLPAESDYASGPYTISETTGEFRRDGTAISSYQSLSIRINNRLHPLHEETKWLKTCGAHGREATIAADALYKTSPDHLADLQAGTARSYVVKFTKGTKVLTIDFNDNNHISAAAFNIPLGQEIRQNITVMNKWDRAANSGAGGDVDYTYVAS